MANIKERKSVKRTFTLSAETTGRFERLVPPRRRSQLVEHLLQRELDEIQRQELRDSIERGWADMSDVNADVARDWASTEKDDWPTK